MAETTEAPGCRVINDKLEMVAVADLKLHPRNPRRGDVGAIQESIEENGFYGAVVAQRSTAYVLAGNHRLKAAIEAGMEHVPVFWVDVDDDRALRILLADNRTNDLAGYDDETLARLLKELQEGEIGFLGTGYDTNALDELLKELGEPDLPLKEDPGAELAKAEELQIKWKTERGQLWLIGEHRLLCGDSTNEGDVRRLMDGKRAQLFATDPPYLVDYDGTNHPSSWEDKKLVKAGRKKDKNKDWSDSYGKTWDDATQGEGLYDGFVRVAVELAIDDNAAWYCWHAQRNQAMLERVWLRHGAFWHQTIVWVKTCPVLGYSYYMNKSESCAFGWVRGHEPPRVASDFPPNVWEFPNRGEGHDDVEHPTVKPAGVFTIPMLQHTKPGDLCYEPFAGSGTQLVAAEQLGRVCCAMEIEPKYVAVALERLSGMGLDPKLAGP
ncbi:MAG: ParB N-terminal domain-containing protein [Fimbriimonadia bacterium]|jgi:DNA modification methylase